MMAMNYDMEGSLTCMVMPNITYKWISPLDMTLVADSSTIHISQSLDMQLPSSHAGHFHYLCAPSIRTIYG